MKELYDSKNLHLIRMILLGQGFYLIAQYS